MGDLIEVAELDTGKRELKLERITAAASFERGARPLLRRGREEAHPGGGERLRRPGRRAGRPASVAVDSRQSAVECDPLHAGGWRDSAGRRRDQELCAVQRARHRPRHRGGAAEHDLRPLQYPSQNRARGWDWRWSGGWWSRWAARSPWRAGWATDRHSDSRCPWLLRRKSNIPSRWAEPWPRSYSRRSRNPPSCASTSARRRAWARPTTC